MQMQYYGPAKIGLVFIPYCHYLNWKSTAPFQGSSPESGLLIMTKIGSG